MVTDTCIVMSYTHGLVCISQKYVNFFFWGGESYGRKYRYLLLLPDDMIFFFVLAAVSTVQLSHEYIYTHVVQKYATLWY